MKRSIRLACLLTCTLLLAACAGQSAYREGRMMLAEGRVEQGLSELQRAMQEAPGNHEIRNYYYRQRDVVLGQMLSRADAARQQGQLDEADANYRQVQEIDRNNDRARSGRAMIVAERRHRERLQEAESQLKAGKVEAAEQLVRGILNENPGQREAKALKRRLAERSMAADDMPASLKSNLARPVTVEFRDAPIRSVFDFLSRAAGINFILDKEVRSDSRTTLYVKNNTVEDVIRVTLLTSQLDYKVLNENTLLIYPSSQAKAKDYKDLMVKGFYLNNADVKQIANTIKTLVKTKDLIIDEKLNYLAMRDTPEAIRMAERLIANQDLPDPEVILEVEVLEVSVNRLQELGVRYPEQLSAGIVGSDNVPGSLRLNEWKSRDSSLVQLTVTNPALILNLRKTDSDTNLLANPRIRVKSKDKARIHIGERVPVITTTSTANVGVSEAVNYLDVGLKLDVEPVVSLDDEVSMKVSLEVSNILETIVRASGLQTYRLGTRNAATTLRLKDSETQVLAGLIQDDERKSANKVPGLGDIPVVGRLFSNHSDINTKTEIVLLITPRIVRNLNLSESVDTSFYSGTEAVIGVSPVRLRPIEGDGKATSTAAGTVPPSDPQRAESAASVPTNKAPPPLPAGFALPPNPNKP